MCYKKQQWSKPDESIVFFSEMVGYYHGFFYQVYALCSMMIIINNSCKHVPNFEFMAFHKVFEEKPLLGMKNLSLKALLPEEMNKNEKYIHL